MRKLHVLLPGYSLKPIGGYKVVYEYADWIARNGSHEVHVHHVEVRPGSSRSPVSRLKRRLVVLFGAAVRRPLWFGLPRTVKFRVWLGHPRILLGPDDAIVATAAETAPLVADMIEDVPTATGSYFIQHYENWSMADEAVVATWRLPLNLIVIAPWLERIAAGLGVKATLVLNGADSSAFPTGPPISERRSLAIGMTSNSLFKRTDILVNLMNQLEEDGFETALFGTGSRPKNLNGRTAYTKRPSQSQLRTLYQDARVLICTSDSEGWYLPGSEALLSGCGLVSTRNGGVDAYASTGALFADPGDRDALLSAARNLLTHPELAQALADSGRTNLETWGPNEAASAFYNAVAGKN